MIIGVPREIKTEEYRVGITPSGVAELKNEGHEIIVEKGAGSGSGFSDNEYIRAGALIADNRKVYSADLVVKVKEPLLPEYNLITEESALFTYLHLAPNRELTDILLKKKVAAFGYETLARDGGLPLLVPMSEIAGRMAPLMGLHYLQRIYGGSGILAPGSAGVKPAKALILGAGVVGTNSARICHGLGMDTTLMNRGIDRLNRIDEMFMGRVKTLPLTESSLRDEIRDADIIVCAVLVPGGRAPVLIKRDMLSVMKKGSIIVDVSVDQGGCAETTRPSTHDNPVYEVDGIIHYTVANMPGAYPRTSTFALTNATLPYIRKLAGTGIKSSLRLDGPLRSSLNTYKGWIVHKTLADSLCMVYRDADEIEG